jgi:hypothetical protein
MIPTFAIHLRSARANRGSESSMLSMWSRRKFLTQAGISAASLVLGAQSKRAQASRSALSGRFLTHVSVLRVNQIEVTPTRNIGEDEAVDNRPERVRSRREAFARGCPNGRMTWAISWLALIDTRKEYVEARLPHTTTATATKSPSSRAATLLPCTTPASTIAKPSTRRSQ